LQTIVSSEEGLAHCWINQNAKLSLGYFEAGSNIPYQFNPVNKCLYIFCIAGKMEVEKQTLEQKDAIGLWDISSTNIHCTTEVEFIIIETVVNQK